MENQEDKVLPVSQTEFALLASVSALKEEILKGIDQETPQGGLLSTVIDRAIGGTLDSVQSTFHLLARKTPEGEDREHPEGGHPCSLSQVYFASVNS